MKVFKIKWSGSVLIEAESEEDALKAFQEMAVEAEGEIEECPEREVG